MDAPIANLAVAGTNALHIELEPGEDQNAAEAKARVHPVVTASATIRQFDSALAKIPFAAVVAELTCHVNDTKAGKMNRPEAMLLSQAHTLDAIFNSLASRAGANIGKNQQVAETYLRMALKAQSQCRTTLEALAELKAPKVATFVKQQNVANQQQVNNGNVVNGGSNSAHEKSLNQANELLTEAVHAPLDTRGTRPTGGTDSQLETVGEINRAKKRRRKVAQ